MINWLFYPKNKYADELSRGIIAVFEEKHTEIDSSCNDYKSDEVLAIVKEGLVDLGFNVEKSKKHNDKIQVPVLFGTNGRIEKAFEADAFHKEAKYIIEVEAGRAVVNYQFLKDFFEACAMSEVDHLCIAVRNTYRNYKDFDRMCLFFDALYQSGRLGIPLKGLLLIGY